MKILQVIPALSVSFGGPPAVVTSISKQLAKKHDVVVYTTTALDVKHDFTSKSETLDGYQVFYFNRSFKSLAHSYLFGELSLSLEMTDAVMRHLKEFDIIHIHSWREFPDLMLHHYAKKYSVPYVLQSHGCLSRERMHYRKWLYDALFGYNVLKDASKVIALTATEAQQYADMGLHMSDIALIPNGVDFSRFDNFPLQDSFKNKFGIAMDKSIVLYLGRLHYNKGIDILIKAFANVIKKYPNCMLVVAGPDHGALYELKRLVTDLKLDSDVLFTGTLSDKEKFQAYAEAIIHVLPSRHEGLPIRLLEAYACGKPVIASAIAELKGLIIDGETGLLFEPENEVSLGQSLFYLLTNETEASEMGRIGKTFAKRTFGIENTVCKLEDIYLESIMANRNKQVLHC